MKPIPTVDQRRLNSLARINRIAEDIEDGIQILLSQRLPQEHNSKADDLARLHARFDALEARMETMIEEMHRFTAALAALR